MTPFLKKIFNRTSGNAAEFKVQPPPEREATKMFVTTLLERPATQAPGHSYFCMAAEQVSNGMWHVYRHRYNKNLTAYSTMAFPRPDRLCSLEAACAKLQAFEEEHAPRKDRINKVPDGAESLSDMVALVNATRLKAAEQSAGMAMRMVTRGRKHNAKTLSS